MAGFSLTEKLAVTGAFLALVAMAVGTENDPGIVVVGKDEIAKLRPVTPPAAPAPAPVSEIANAVDPVEPVPTEPDPPPPIVMQAPVAPPPPSDGTTSATLDQNTATPSTSRNYINGKPVT